MKSCGSCTLCCELVPVPALKLGSFQGCPHRRTVLHKGGPGCGIYAQRPNACRQWSCVWLLSPDAGEEEEKLRPDRIGLVIDQAMDLAVINGRDATAAQIWVAPGHEEDWAKPGGAAQAIIQTLLEQVECVLWRVSPELTRGFVMDGETIGVTSLAANTGRETFRDPDKMRRLYNLTEGKGKQDGGV